MNKMTDVRRAKLSEEEIQIQTEILNALEWVENASFKELQVIGAAYHGLNKFVIAAPTTKNIQDLNAVNNALGRSQHVSELNNTNLAAYFLKLDLAAI